jgi:hypothetical protein
MASQMKETLVQGNTSLNACFPTQDFSSESFSSSNQPSFETPLASTGHTCHPIQPITSCANNMKFSQLQSTETCSQINSNCNFFKSHTDEPFNPQMCNPSFYSQPEKWNILNKPYCILPEQHTLPSRDIPQLMNAPLLVPSMEVSGTSTTMSMPTVLIPLEKSSQFSENMDPTHTPYDSTKTYEDSSDFTSSFPKTKKIMQSAYFPTTPSLYNPCVSQNILQKLQNISHLEPEYKKFLKNIPRKSKEAFTPSDFAAFRTCHPQYSSNDSIFN